MKKWVILITLQFRYIFYRPEITRLRARKIGLQYKIPARCASVTLQATAFGQPSRDVLCASEDMACGSVEFKMANNKVDLGQIRSEEIVYSRFIKIPLG